MHYLVTIGYETEQMDREGNPRVKKYKYIIEAESVEEATIVGTDDPPPEIAPGVPDLANDCVIPAVAANSAPNSDPDMPHFFGSVIAPNRPKVTDANFTTLSNAAIIVLSQPIIFPKPEL